MKVTKPRLAIAALALALLYWIPALWFPDQVKAATNASYFLLSLMTSFLLWADVIDIVRTDGDGVSWQVVMAKTGIFLLATAFALGRAWALLLGMQDFPVELLHSPTGTFFTYVQGIGLGALFFGLSQPSEVTPRITARTTILIALVCGVVIGVAIAHLPF